MKSRIYVANWKMNMPLDGALELTKQCKKLMAHQDNKEKQIVLCPTFPALYPIAKLLQSTPIGIGAQNCSEHEMGAYTGEVSAQSLSQVGCTYCIVGHSERRNYFHETNEIIARKVGKLFGAAINPIICIGETAKEHKDNKTLQALEQQLDPIINVINNAEQCSDELYIAYEPVWAIGTGKVPDKATLQTTFNWLHAHVQSALQPAKSVYLLYGGSVDEHTVKDIAEVQYIDGFLVGGASLDFQKFKNIVSLA